MLGKEELIKIEKSFSNVNLLTAIVLVAYYLIFILFGELGKASEFSFAMTAVVLLTAEFVLYKFDLFINDVVIRLYKFIILLIIACGIAVNVIQVCSVVILTIVYMLIVFEYILTFDITEGYSKMLATIQCIIPYCSVILISMLVKSRSNFWVFLSITSVVIYTIIFHYIVQNLSQLFVMFYRKINSLEGIAITNKEENDNMKQYQSKLVQANEQLSIQKFKLQEANETITRNNKDMALQNLLNKAISYGLDVRKLVNSIEEIILENMKVDICSIIILNNDEICDDKFISISKYTRASCLGKGNISTLEDKEFADGYIENMANIKFDSNANKELDFLSGSKIESVIIFPIIINEQISAIYVIGSVRASYFNDNLTFLKNISSQINLGINNSMLYSKMHTMATRDVLTGLYNRRYFNTFYQSYLNYAVDNNKILTVILFDIDKFKNINDNYGHVFGDEVINYCGHTALEYANKYDALPVRYGGEEFVIVFPDKDVTQVTSIVEDMHKRIKNKIYEVNEKTVSINVSIGIASYPANCVEPNELLNAADSAMYVSKKNGRGRITIYSLDE